MSNLPSGFDGFQARLERAAEAMGGDELAWLWAEHRFAAGIQDAMRERDIGRDLFKWRRPHRGEWLRAGAADWDAAAKIAEESIYWPESKQIIDLPPGRRWIVICHSRAVLRSTREAAIPLAYRRGNFVGITEAGEALAQERGMGFRTCSKYLKDEERAISALHRLAEREFADA